MNNKLMIDQDKNLLNYENILKEIETGNQKAFKLIFDVYYNNLFDFAKAITKDVQKAEECVLDIMQNLWQNRENIRNICNLKSYLFVAVKNQALKYLKKERIIDLIDLYEISTDYFKFEITPEQMMISEEKIQQIKKAIESLPPRCKTIFKLVRDEGLKYKEIAKILDISVNTIDQQMAIAVKKIAQSISEGKKTNLNQLYFILLFFLKKR